MSLEKGHIALCIMCILVGFLLAMPFKGCSRDETISIVEVHDTISVIDTLRIEGKTITKYVTYHDTIIRHIVDTTIMIHDDDTIRIPIEHREYCDSVVTDSSRIAWSVQYHGYRAKIDSFGIDYTFRPRTIVKTKENGFGQFVGIGIGVGYGVSVIDRRVYAAPNISLNIVYGIGYTWRKGKK